MPGFLWSVGLTLIVALVFGEVVERAGQPGLLGEIVAGVVLGPSVLGVVDPVGTFEVFATIGAILLFFDVGYEELDLEDLLAAGSPAIRIALAGMVIPGIGGFVVGRTFGYSVDASLFLGLVFAVTSIAVTVRTLQHLGRLSTPYGLQIVGAAVVDDIVGLLALAIILVTAQEQTTREAALAFGLLIVFFVGVIGVAWLVPRISRVLVGSVQRGADFLAIMSGVFVMSYAAELAGMTAEIGAFIAGLIVGSEERFERIRFREEVTGVSYGLFIPVFFAWIGAQMDIRLLAELDVFIVTVVVIGLLTKAIGGYLGSRLVGEPHDESLLIGVGLVPKSEVGLAIVAIGISHGIIDNRVLSAFLVLMMVSIIVAPPLLEYAARDLPRITPDR